MGSISLAGQNAGKFHWFGQDIKNSVAAANPAAQAPQLAGLPAIAKAGPDSSDVATQEAALQGLNQRMQSAQMSKFALGDPSQTPLGTKTLLGS